MLGKKRVRNKNEENKSQPIKKLKIITNEKNIKENSTKEQQSQQSYKKIKYSGDKNDEFMGPVKNVNFLFNSNKDIFLPFDNNLNENDDIKSKTFNFTPKISYSKLNIESIKQKFKQLDNTYEENNISILDNIDRLTSILSSINIAQNEQKKENNENIDEDLYKNTDSEKQNLEINPFIIDANNDHYLNYLLSLNDTLKKKYNESIKFDEINNFFTNFAFDKIENYVNLLKSIK